MFFVTGAVGFVAAGFFENLFNLQFLGEWSIILLFISCVLILGVGKFHLLDNLIKVIVTIYEFASDLLDFEEYQRGRRRARYIGPGNIGQQNHLMNSNMSGTYKLGSFFKFSNF